MLVSSVRRAIPVPALTLELVLLQQGQHPTCFSTFTNNSRNAVSFNSVSPLTIELSKFFFLNLNEINNLHNHFACVK